MITSTRIATLGLAVASTIVLGGCASALSGVGGTESYACKAPIGAQCTSVSGVYANANGSAISRSNASISAKVDLLNLRIDHEAQRPQGPLAMPSVPVAIQAHQPDSNGTVTTVQESGATVGTMASQPTPALRSPPRVIRLWIAPWEDADGDLHDASFVHVVIDTGRWLIERVRPAPRSRTDMATPPIAPTRSDPAPSDAKPASDLSPTEP